MIDIESEDEKTKALYGLDKKETEELIPELVRSFTIPDLLNDFTLLNGAEFSV